MNLELALHTAARRICMSRFEHWSTTYMGLVESNQDRIGAEYTDRAYQVFPRYNLVEAVLSRIEELNPDQLPELDELRRRLIEAAETASSDFTELSTNQIHNNAMADERAALANAFLSLSLDELLSVKALFFRRTLAADEIRSWRRVILAAWGAPDGYWYPLGPKTHPSLVALELGGIDEDELQSKLSFFFSDNAIDRFVELREHGVSHEIQAGAMPLTYNGAEGFWTTNEAQWIIYCSHERTMTLGGKIAKVIAPDYPASIYDPSQPPA